MRLVSIIMSSMVLHFALPHHQSLAQQVKEAPLRAHLAFLSDDLLEGRGTGQRGGDLAVRYLEAQAAAMGLVPLPGANGYRQTVTLVGSQTLSSSQLHIETSKATLSPVAGTEIVYGSSNGKANNDIDAPIVFVGYGVRAPEEQWDDYKGADLKGKLLIMMANDPQPTAEEPNRFAGKALTYYGRWTYKFEEAARQGAAGVLLIHTLPSASYAWNVPQTSFSHERFSLGSDGNKGNALEGWIQEDAAKALFSAAGQNLDTLRAQAETRGFKPATLDARIHVTLRSTVRKVEQQNIIGMVPGKDIKLKHQAVLYSAHWDHLGIVQEPGQAAQIWNGAVDNASGAAALLAMAQAAVTHPTKRTQIFLWPAAEEQGLLGSAFYVQHPLWPLEKTAADLNLDSMNFVGKTQDMGVAGSEHSSLFNSAKSVAKKMGLRIAPPVADLGGAFFRADHFNFVRAGVPAFNVGSAVFSGDGSFAFDHDAEQEAAQMKAFKKDYHTPRDRYNPAWDLTGMLQQAQFTLYLGYVIANDAAMPVWKKNGTYSRIAQ